MSLCKIVLYAGGLLLFIITFKLALYFILHELAIFIVNNVCSLSTNELNFCGVLDRFFGWINLYSSLILFVLLLHNHGCTSASLILFVLLLLR